MIEFKMPSLGADMEDGILRSWRVKPGDSIRRGDIIAEVEVQKGNIDIECFDDGTIVELLIKENEKVPVGSVMAIIQPLNDTTSTPASEIETTPLAAPPVIPEPPIRKISEPELPPKIPAVAAAEIKASPLAKRLAAENKLNLSDIKGTGEGGVITRDDVEKALAAGTSQYMESSNKSPLTPAENIRMAVAAAMSKSNREIPHYYLEKKIDITNMTRWLQTTNATRPVQERLLPAAIFLKATAKALQSVPDLNAVWQDGLQRKTAIHIGLVVSLKGGGIIVPAIHDTNKKSMDEIMASLNDIIPRARALKLRSSELSDSTITMTNLGEGGADKVLGIIYPPQVAIIGIGAPFNEIIYNGSTQEERTFVYITLAGDHRATDGLTGSKYLQILNQLLQQPETL